MEQYRTALNHLNMALDVMVEHGDSLLTANIAYPIHLCEIAIFQQQNAIINEKLRDVGGC